MVKKGEMVTLTLRNSKLALTLQGKALQGGAEGDVVRVLNTASNQVVEGIVTGPQTVSVKAPSNRLAQN
jgi:flagella basal body P-ring formation protein FlgA